LDTTRRIIQALCDCKGGIEGKCEHTAALVAYVNSEDSATQTSRPNQWKVPSNKQLKLYVKALLLAHIPEMVVKMNSSQGLMLRAFLKLQENSRRLQEVLPCIGRSSLRFSSPERKLHDIENVEHIMLDADECDSVAARTVQQSLCPEWQLLRKDRLSASSKAHRIRVREADFEELAHDLCNQKKFQSNACKYGTETEPTARKRYEEGEGCTVIRIGLVISKVQGWLCCSPDGLVQAGDDNILLEIKCPCRCRDKPICDKEGNLFFETHASDLACDTTIRSAPPSSGITIITLCCDWLDASDNPSAVRKYLARWTHVGSPIRRRIRPNFSDQAVVLPDRTSDRMDFSRMCLALNTCAPCCEMSDRDSESSRSHVAPKDHKLNAIWLRAIGRSRCDKRAFEIRTEALLRSRLRDMCSQNPELIASRQTKTIPAPC
ncbi:hypothetical protein HPB47_025760, partial [Ixodes persulcatus]